jgi:hypothetical protein
MDQISSLSKARSAGRYCLSVKLRNAADGLIWSTGGRISALSGLRYAPLMVGQTMAGNMPRQQARKSGQMIPYKQERV